MQVGFLKQKIIVLAVIVFVIITFIWLNLSKNSKTKPSLVPSPSSQQNETPKILSTKPDPLEGAIVEPDATVEITFSHPLENAPEFKHRIDPEIEYNLQLSFDRKTVKITPKKGFEIGTTYTLFIHQDAKFEGGGRLDGEKLFHFQTIKYRGV